MKVLDLFSGIGGFSLGLERAGMETIAFCEIDPFCRKVLKKHWPDVPIHEDIKELDGEQYRGAVDVVCGGFPCQDISAARGADATGINGLKSGLWSELRRIMGECRPRFGIFENSAMLTSRGLEHVLYDLCSLGYDAVWHCIPASAVGAPHQRDRIWIIAHTSEGATDNCRWATECSRKMAAHIADADSDRFQKTHALWEWRVSTRGRYWYETEPDVRRVDDGLSNWSHRIGALGNAVVPQIPELIGKAIMEAA